ncbi:hypothetical protein HK101_009542 [Irineochytrium annulatum]|nr:hypothetical protein HK101_009542 [Irineochytrium annulatum]
MMGEEDGRALFSPSPEPQNGRDPYGGYVSDDTDLACDDMSPEEMEEHDTKTAHIVSFLEDFCELEDLPPDLWDTALRRKMRKARRENRPFDPPNPPGQAGPSKANFACVKTCIESIIIDDDEDPAAMAARRALKRKTMHEELLRQEEEDMKFAMQLQEEEDRLAGRPASIGYVQKPKPPVISKSEEERRAALKQMEEDQIIARRLQAELDREAITEHTKARGVRIFCNGLVNNIALKLQKATPMEMPKPGPARFVPGVPAFQASSSSSSSQPNGYSQPQKKTRYIDDIDVDHVDFIDLTKGINPVTPIKPAVSLVSPVPSKPAYVPVVPNQKPVPPGHYAPSYYPPPPPYIPVAPAPTPPVDPDDVTERPLNDKEQEEHLKNLLKHAIDVADVPKIEERIKSPEDLKITLLEHQKIGVEWMVKMEKGTNKGGILADDMGLGKTIQAISTMILNRSEDSNQRTTLIVAPTSLVIQWKEEIRNRVESGVFKVLLYYGKDKKAMTLNTLKNYDIVITTYGIVGMEFPQPIKKAKAPAHSAAEREAADDADFEQELREREAMLARIEVQKGPLLKMNWYRVVLDEAHTIKNKSTRCARSVVELKSKYRWCLTGTPFQNNVGDLYSLLYFLKIQPYCEWERFREQIQKPMKAGRHKKAMKRVQALLKSVCLRRNKNSSLDGKPIIMLPPKEVFVDEVDFSPSERDFYTSLEQKTLLRFNKYLREGTVMQNYSNVLVLLLRLRQACCHPTLVSQHFNEATPEELAALEAEQRLKEAQEAAVAAGRPVGGVPAVKKDIELASEVVQRLWDLNVDSKEITEECAICMDAITDGQIIPGCGHLYCGECLQDHVNRDPALGEKSCPQCRGRINDGELMSVKEFVLKYGRKKGATPKKVAKSRMIENSDTEDDEAAVEPASKKKKGKEPVRDDDDDEDMDEFVFDASWVSSTKIEELMKILDNVRTKHAGEKVIVFSQFRGMMDLCETPLRKRKIGFVRYDGSMTADKRDEAVQQLEHDPNIMVILISLKCGSLGLNLTCANRVVMLDFWWNPAVENQAVDRVHRVAGVLTHFAIQVRTDEACRRAPNFNQKHRRAAHLSPSGTEAAVESSLIPGSLLTCFARLFNAALGEGGTKGLGNQRLGLNDLIKLFGAGADPHDESDDD